MTDDFKITVCASCGGGNFEAIINNQAAVGYTINLLIVDRECGAVSRALRHGIPYVLLDKKKSGAEFFDHMDQAIPRDTDLIFLAGFFPIIDGAFCRKWARRIVNIHPSLLPKYGGKGMYGVKVQEAVLAHHETHAGCTVHYVDEHIDGGEIILQKSIPVDPAESAWDLGGRIFQEEIKLSVEAIKLIMHERDRGNA
jgi:phosphoribosylglycinamide formyltransferase-1